MRVRRRSDSLIAKRVREARPVELPSGETRDIRAGDWLIVRGQTVVDTAFGHALDEKYDIVPEGELKVPATVCQRIEQTVGLGATRDPYVLVEAIERLAAISIGTVHVEFTPGQLEEIAHRATKRGHSVEQELRLAVDRVKDEIFHRG